MAFADNFRQVMQRPETRAMLSSYATALTDPNSGGLGRAAALGAGMYQDQLRQMKQEALQNKLQQARLDSQEKQEQAMERQRKSRERVWQSMQKQYGDNEKVQQVLKNNPWLEYSMTEGSPDQMAKAGKFLSESVKPPQPEVKSSFGAVDPRNPQDMFTALRTDQGIFRQVQGDDGQPKLVPVPSNRAVPISRQITDQQKGAGIKPTDLGESEVAVRTFLSTSKDAINLLDENPDINTLVAKGASLVNDLQQEAKAIGKTLGIDMSSVSDDPNAYKNTFDELGITNARMQGLVTALAFQAAAASGQTGRSVSNRDIERFIGEIGAKSADPRAFKATLQDVRLRSARSLATKYAVAGKEVPEDIADILLGTEKAGKSEANRPDWIPEDLWELATPEERKEYVGY